MTPSLAADALTPAEAWSAWSFDPLVVIGLAATAWLYGTGVRRLWRGGHAERGVGFRHVGAFAGGLLAVAVALVSPVDAMSQALLSAHMVQHLLLTVVAPPLLVLGRPLIAAAAVRSEWRRSALRLARRRFVRASGRLLGHPLVAWFLALVTLWTWHLPAFYDSALRNEAVHVVEHSSFLAVALLFWGTALRPTGPRRLPGGLDVLFVATGALHGAVLGALLAFAATPLYASHAESARAWGVSPLADQQWAGAVMWIPSSFVYLVAASALFVRWLRSMDREAAREEGRLGRFGNPAPERMTVSSERSHVQ